MLFSQFLSQDMIVPDLLTDSDVHLMASAKQNYNGRITGSALKNMFSNIAPRGRVKQ